MKRFLTSVGVLAFACSSFGAALPGIDVTNTVTATMDGGTSKSGATWYEKGVNVAAPTTGISTGIVVAEWDPFSQYLIQPGNAMNAVMLDSGKTSTSLTFTRPFSVTSLSLAGASGNGRGTNVATLRFSDGTSTTLAPFVVPDWFFVEPRIQTANGRINVLGNSFSNVNSDNPRILPVNVSLSAEDQLKFLTGIDLAWTGSGANTHTAIFGVSGDFSGLGHYTPMPLDAGVFNQDVIVGLLEVPEPGTLTLLGLGAAMMVIRLRRNRV